MALAAALTLAGIAQGAWYTLAGWQHRKKLTLNGGFFLGTLLAVYQLLGDPAMRIE